MEMLEPSGKVWRVVSMRGCLKRREEFGEAAYAAFQGCLLRVPAVLLAF